jgi:hypothetical protein
MKMIKKMTCLAITALLLLHCGLTEPVSAAVNPAQAAPTKLRVEAINENQPTIGYNESDRYYADLKGDELTAPTIPGASPSLFLNYYLQEVNKGYKPVKPVSKKEGDVTANSGTNSMRLRELTSGTVYYAYTKAYYSYTIPAGTTYTSSESTPSNTVKFMTDIAINAYSYGPNQIKIEWDDVWNSGKRMDYKLYVSENKTFTNTQPMYIGQEQISQNGPVTVNEATGMLEYIYTVRDPGRVYYIKIVPDTTDTELKRSAESKTVIVSSFILAKTTKMSVTQDGTIWKLEWSPVVTGIADSNIKVSYQIYKGTGTTGGIEQYMASIDDTNFFLTLQTGEESNYYIIRAIVTRNGQELYPGIRIQSQKIYVRESEVPSKPSVPELTEAFKNAADTIISYTGELTATSATVLWKVPRKGNGDIDDGMKYDIWLISDPNLLDEPPTNTLIASSVKMNSTNFVLSGTKLLGYKFKINELVPNTTYYFKIVAKKDYVDFVDNKLADITLQSDPAIKVIITPTLGSIEQPIVPGKPPFELKRDRQGKDMVTTGSAVVTLKNKWYEQYTILPGGGSAWVYRTPQQLETTSPGAVKAIEDGTADPLKYRKIEYDDGVTIDVGCIPFTPDINYNNIEKLLTNKIIGFPVTPNDPGEDADAVDGIHDGAKHNIDITINDLGPNTTYIVWVRAARRNVNLVSGASDPIIITTIPDLPVTIEKPTVPVFNYNHAADTSIDLGWNFNPEYTYYLEYGTSDNRSSASGKVVITPEELKNFSYYRVKDLKPDTLYYFWIQAEASNTAGDKKRSDFSDSLLVKTEKDIPPETPRGFGVKGTTGSVTKNAITYEWIMEDGMEYMLEYASDINYKDGKKIKVGSVSEYKLEGLRSNFRYYARLYAVDPKKELTSEPTQSVIVRTLRSSDDYDSSEDVENVISGDFIKKDTSAVNGEWTVSIIGVNADRFVQHVQTDTKLDYIIDLKTMPAGTKKIIVLISQNVFKALGMLGENIDIKTVRNMLIIRPGVLADNNGVYGTASGGVNFEIGITLDSTASGSDTSNLTFKSAISEIEIGFSGGFATPMENLEKPLKVEYEYTSADWYKKDVTAGYVLPAGGTSAWQECSTVGNFDADTGLGRLSFETNKPGRMAVGEKGKNYFSDISNSYARKSIENVASVHDLKSVSGKKFEPEKNLTMGDAVKFMFDMQDVGYGSDYMTLAARAGIIQSTDSGSTSANCTREKLIAMVVRICELKTSAKAKATVDDTGVYKDIGQVSAALLPKIKFAQENGVITSRFSDTLGPKDPITRAETMVLLEKMLRYSGEL